MNELEAEPRGGARRRGLGMGLSALLGGASDLTGAEGVRTVPIELLRPCGDLDSTELRHPDVENEHVGTMVLA